MEEGSPMIPPGGSTQITFTPRPFGLHWYHTHAAAHRDLKRGFTAASSESCWLNRAPTPRRYDQEQFLVLHDWDPYFVGQRRRLGDGELRGGIHQRTHARPRCDPIQVKEGQRVLFHILNASAPRRTGSRLPAISFRCSRSMGAPSRRRQRSTLLRLGPAERDQRHRHDEHAGRVDPRRAARCQFSQTRHGHGRRIRGQSREAATSAARQSCNGTIACLAMRPRQARKPDVTVPLVFTSHFEGHGALDRWMINGKSFPETDPVLLQERAAPPSRLRQPKHRRSPRASASSRLRTGFNSRQSHKRSSERRGDRGSRNRQSKSTCVADNPGNTLFHCHQQDHMDSGFMTLFRYA